MKRALLSPALPLLAIFGMTFLTALRSVELYNMQIHSMGQIRELAEASKLNSESITALAKRIAALESDQLSGPHAPVRILYAPNWAPQGASQCCTYTLWYKLGLSETPTWTTAPAGDIEEYSKRHSRRVRLWPVR